MSDRGKGKSKREKEARLQRLRDHLDSLDPTEAPDELLHLARAVAGVQDQVMSCEACQAWLPSYVDAEVGGLAVGRLYPEVKRHLDLCADCETEYLEMLELALVEDAGELPALGALPAPYLAFLPPLSLPEYVRDLTEELIARKAPHLMAEVQAIADVFFERVAALGERFTPQAGLAPVLGPGDETTEALQILAATYVATQSVVADLSPREIEAQARTGQLTGSLRHRAEQVARDLGLSSREAQAFAEEYAELVCQDPHVLQELAAR